MTSELDVAGGGACTKVPVEVSAGLASLSLIMMISGSSRRSTRPAVGDALEQLGFHPARLCVGARG